MSRESRLLSENFKIECKIVSMESLTVWIIEELNRRDWNPADLAKRAGLSTGSLSNIMNGKRKPGPKALRAIARALGEPPDNVFRLAGLLPKEANPGKDEDQLLAVYRKFSPQEQNFLLELLRARQGQPSLPSEPARPGIIDILSHNPAPDLEDIAEAAKYLDELERRLVYDYIGWRLIEQERRRSSSGKRRDKEQDQETIGLIELYEAVNDATSEDLQDFISYLTNDFLNRKGLNPNVETLASRPPRHNPNQIDQPERG